MPSGTWISAKQIDCTKNSATTGNYTRMENFMSQTSRDASKMSDGELSEALNDLATSMFNRGQWDFSLDLVKEAAKRLEPDYEYGDDFGL